MATVARMDKQHNRPALNAFYAIVLLCILSGLLYADYSDVLLVANSNSAVSLQIADYFQSHRANLTHRLAVTLPEGDSITFALLNSTLLQPARKYLNSTNDTINYIVLTKGFPLYTSGDVLDVFGAHMSIPNANASSVDSELALVNTAYEGSIGAGGYVANPYYGGSNFSRSGQGIYLVTRLDGFSLEDVIRMIDSSANVSRADRDSGQYVLAGYEGIYGNEFESAHAGLKSAGLNGSYYEYGYPSNLKNVSYFDTFGCYDFGGCNNSYIGAPNYTWKNGSFASVRYSFSAGTTASMIANTWYMSENRSYVATFIHEGASGGLGYSVEPLSSGVANPKFISRGYLDGRGMADMLWSSVPSLSWAAVVFGDPKAGEAASPRVAPPAPEVPINASANGTNPDIGPVYTELLHFEPYVALPVPPIQIFPAPKSEGILEAIWRFLANLLRL